MSNPHFEVSLKMTFQTFESISLSMKKEAKKCEFEEFEGGCFLFFQMLSFLFPFPFLSQNMELPSSNSSNIYKYIYIYRYSIEKKRGGESLKVFFQTGSNFSNY